jgi:hypothetical protein
LYPSIRDHPAGFGHKKYFPVNNRAHAAACSQVTFEQVIKAPNGFKNCNGKPGIGIRPVARIIAGAYIRAAAAPMNTLLRVIPRSW